MNTILIQVPLSTAKKAEWEAMLNSPEGIALTSKKKALSLQSLVTLRMKKVILSGTFGKSGKRKKTLPTTILYQNG